MLKLSFNFEVFVSRFMKKGLNFNSKIALGLGLQFNYIWEGGDQVCIGGELKGGTSLKRGGGPDSLSPVSPPSPPEKETLYV